MNDQQIIALFFDRSEQAILELSVFCDIPRRNLTT